ncbi:MAG: NAD(P)-dependent oxidoreductase [Microlunatus sp.]
MRILVTGGSGFIGRWVVEALRKKHADVFVCTRTPSRVTDVAGDLLQLDAPETLVAKVRPDIIVHAAWCVEPDRFWFTPANLDWGAVTLRLARVAAEMGVRRFVGIGTCFEYDWPIEGQCCEATTPIRPTTLYATTKDSVRRVIQEYAKGGGFEFAWARLFYLFGPYEHPKRLVASVASRLARNLPAPLSSGTAVRDFMDVRDAGAAVAALALSSVTGAVNIGSGEATKVIDLARQLQAIAGGTGQLQIGGWPDRAEEPARIVADVFRLRDEVGFKPAASLSERLQETFHWWQRQLTSELQL